VIDIYTDGACSGGYGAWAALVGDELLGEYFGPQTTNNAMEMLAVYEALKSLNHEGADNEVTVYTDSKLVIGWLKYDWKSTANPNINRIRWAIRDIIALLDLHVSYMQVKGHGVCQGNIRVDQLAARLARRQGK
jgi:ribonuclease HI